MNGDDRLSREEDIFSAGVHAQASSSNGLARASSEVDSASTRIGQILLERAREYARIPTRVDAGDVAEVLVLRLRDEHYAVESRLLRSVQSARGVASVPCTPAHVAGILNVRGEILTVVDPAVALGLAGMAEPSTLAQVVLVESPRVRVGLLVDEVLGVQRLALDELVPAPSDRRFVRGIANATIVVLDLEELLADDRFEAFEEVDAGARDRRLAGE